MKCGARPSIVADRRLVDFADGRQKALGADELGETRALLPVAADQDDRGEPHHLVAIFEWSSEGSSSCVASTLTATKRLASTMTEGSAKV